MYHAGSKRGHVSVATVIYWKLCKQRRFAHINKYYPHLLDTVLKIKITKYFWHTHPDQPNEHPDLIKGKPDISVIVDPIMNMTGREKLGV